MKSPNYKVKICVVGCGAIGSRMAKTIHQKFKKDCKITGLYDIVAQKAVKLAKQLFLKGVLNRNLDRLITKSDVVIEAVNAPTIKNIVLKVISKRKSILVMSVGKLLREQSLFKLARKNKCYILLPSGAIAGIDAIKAAHLAKVKRITLITRKPVEGFGSNDYLRKKGIDLSSLKEEKLIFFGRVEEAVKHFPQNINVAATISLAAQTARQLMIKIFVSPRYKRNSHEIIMEGDFGRMATRTDNIVCPDNPKSSYLAVLSGLQTLKQFCTGILVGT